MARVPAAWAGVTEMATGIARTTAIRAARTDGLISLLLGTKGCAWSRIQEKRQAGEVARRTSEVGTLIESGVRPAITSVSSRTISSLTRSSGCRTVLSGGS